MQIRPMRRNLQPADLRGDHGVLVGLRRRQSAGRIQPDQLIPHHRIIEHAFNIWPTADKHPPIPLRHSQPTTPDESGQQAVGPRSVATAKPTSLAKLIAL